jgi:hypothetical protein
VVTMGSLPKLHKTSSLMLGTLHHMGVLDFVVTGQGVRHVGIFIGTRLHLSF